MRKLLSVLIVFTMSISIFATSRTGYYQSGQTKASVLLDAKVYEDDLITYKYNKVAENKNNRHDYTQTWEYVSGGATSRAVMRYQFFDDKIQVTMTDAAFVSKDGVVIPLVKNDPTEVKRKVYESLENVMITVLFTYLKVSETPGSPTQSSSSSIRKPAATYDFINASYLAGDDKAAGKKFHAEYVDEVLKKAYVVNYLTSTTADKQQIKYTLDDEAGTATIIIDYQFRDKDFTIMIKSIEYYNKNAKSTTVISKESSTSATINFYNLIKDYFVNKNANYIAPGVAPN